MEGEKTGAQCGRNGFARSGEKCRRFLKKNIDKSFGLWYSIVKGMINPQVRKRGIRYVQKDFEGCHVRNGWNVVMVLRV